MSFVTAQVETGGVDPRGEILLVNPDGSGLSKLTEPPSTEGEPLWSPDGTRLAFQGVPDGVPGLFHMRPDGTDVVHVFFGPRDRLPADLVP